MGPDGKPYRKYMQAFSGESDTTIIGMPYTKGTVFLHNLADTALLRELGFLPLRPSEWSLLTDPRIEDVIAHPKLYQDRPELPGISEYHVFRTYWPMDLDTKKLPPTVINLISEYVINEKGEKRARPSAHIIQYK